MDKHKEIQNSQIRKRKVGVSQTSKETMNDEIEASNDSRDTSFSLSYSTESKDSNNDYSEKIKKISFDIRRPDSSFYSGIDSIRNENMIFVNETQASRNNENEKMFQPCISQGTQNYLSLGTKSVFATMKIVMVGDAGVGKTSLINVLMGNSLTLDYKPTIGVDFATQLVPGPQDTVVKLQFWDFSGQDRFRVLSRAYFRGAQGCIMVFDLSRRKSFEQLPLWEEQIKVQDQPEKCSTILLANKDDLSSMVDNNEVEQFVEEFEFVGWKKVSAFDGRRVKDALDTLVKWMIEKELLKRKSKEPNSCSCSDIVKLGEPEPKSSGKKSCICC